MSNSDNYHYSLPSKHWCPAANTKYLQPFTEKVLTIILPLNYRLCLTINLRNLKLLSMFYMTSYKIHFHYLVTDIMLCWANLPGLSWNSLPQNSVNIHTHTHTHTKKLPVTTCPVSDHNKHREVILKKTLSPMTNHVTMKYTKSTADAHFTWS